MTYDQDLIDKVETLVKVLFSFSILVFNMMKLLLKTFIFKLLYRYLTCDIRYYPFKRAVFIY